MDCSPLHASAHGIFWTRILEWVAISFFKRPSRPRDQTRISCGSCTAGRFFTTEPLGSLVQSHSLKTIQRAECWRIGAFELWFWRRLLRVPWAARRSSLSILKEVKWKSLSCVGLCNHISSSVYGILQARTGVGSCSLLQGIFPTQGIESRFPTLKADSLLSQPPGKPNP